MSAAIQEAHEAYCTAAQAEATAKERFSGLEAKRQALRQSIKTVANDLSVARSEKAKALGRCVTDASQELAAKDARAKVEALASWLNQEKELLAACENELPRVVDEYQQTFVPAARDAKARLVSAVCEELGERMRAAVKDDLLALLGARSHLGEFYAKDILLSIFSPMLEVDYEKQRGAFARKFLSPRLIQ